MDTMNPAVNQLFAMPPAAVEAVRDDPANLQPIARVMGAVNLHNLFMQVTGTDATIQQRIEFQKLVNKIGRLEPDEKQASTGGAGVIINITRAKDSSERLTIEGTAVAIPDAAQD